MGRERSERGEQILDLWATGYTRPQIMASTGATKRSVDRALQCGRRRKDPRAKRRQPDRLRERPCCPTCGGPMPYARITHSEGIRPVGKEVN